jgi:hypothetical protein
MRKPSGSWQTIHSSGAPTDNTIPLHVQWLLLSLSEAFPALRFRDVAISVEPYRVHPAYLVSEFAFYIAIYPQSVGNALQLS